MDRTFPACLIALGAALLAAAPSLCIAQERKLIPVTLSLQWYPQPEDGQFFAAKAEHEASGIASPGDLKGRKIYLPGAARLNYWPWLKGRYGLSDDQIRAFDPSYRAFALDREATSQGFITNDALNCAKVEVACKSLLLADFGWGAYGNTVDTTEPWTPRKK